MELVTFLQDIGDHPSPIQKLIKDQYSKILYDQIKLSGFTTINVDETIQLLQRAMHGVSIIKLIFKDCQKIYVERNFLCKIEFFKLLIEDMNIHRNVFLTEIKVTNIKYHIMQLMIDHLNSKAFEINFTDIIDVLLTADYLLLDSLVTRIIVVFTKNYKKIFTHYINTNSQSAYQVIYNCCDILEKNKSSESILTMLKNTDLCISQYMDIFFNSSLYQHILGLDIHYATELVIQYRYYSFFEKINDNDVVITTLLKTKAPFDYIKSLYQKHIMDDAILSCYDDIPEEFFNLELSNNLLFILILKYKKYDRLEQLNGPITQHHVVTDHLTKYITQLLIENNCIIMLTFLHNKLGKIFENCLITIMDDVPEFICKMNIENFSEHFIWQLIIKFNRYDYLDLLTPTNKYDLPTNATKTVFYNIILNLLNQNNFKIIEKLKNVFGVIVENTLIALLDHIPEETINSHLCSNELILLLVVKFNKIIYLNLLNEPLSKILPYYMTVNYLSKRLCLFMEQHLEYFQMIYPIFYQLFGSYVDDQIINSSGLIKHYIITGLKDPFSIGSILCEKVYQLNIVGNRLQSLLTLKYGPEDQVRNVIFKKNDPLIINIINLLRLRNPYIPVMKSNCLFLNYSNHTTETAPFFNSIVEILNFVPDVRTWKFVGTVHHLHINASSYPCILSLNQEILIRYNDCYTIDRIEKLIVNHIEVDTAIPLHISCNIYFKDLKLYNHNPYMPLHLYVLES